MITHAPTVWPARERELSPEERDLLKIAREMATDFMNTELAATETKIKELKHELDIRDTGKGIAGEETLLQLQQHKKEVVRQLIAACDQRFPSEVFRRRLQTAQERLSEIDRRMTIDDAYEEEFWQAWMERDIMEELLEKWLVWLKEKNLPDNKK